ncbi:hypothetical protein [Methanonatronarchaeum sp. AMET6-2]|uniref:hypothetical protein n=1 Tax=Methanonatronarchaeum sp. AMET6-2 TaxID=2933293 RepID=UPI001FF3D325|nr:hypothetical protein [Methanonatronarchaeum sp. AMET6-2]UOY10613.1 hypothetical protein MU439_02955 [Methanonatronarchaeum sp. AMET6-2]
MNPNSSALVRRADSVDDVASMRSSSSENVRSESYNATSKPTPPVAVRKSGIP